MALLMHIIDQHGDGIGLWSGCFAPRATLPQANRTKKMGYLPLALRQKIWQKLLKRVVNFSSGSPLTKVFKNEHKNNKKYFM
jgi:hypothetical protein